MPNWVNTEIILNNNTENNDVLTLMNILRKNDGLVPLANLDETYPECCLSSVVGRAPECYKYDTTNYNATDIRNKMNAGIKEFTDRFGVVHELNEDFIKEWEDATEEQKSYGAIGWYDYNVNTYGTKWDSHIDVTPSFRGVVMYVSTAWSPAEPVFEALAKLIHANGLSITMHVKIREEIDEFMGVYDNDSDGSLAYTEVDPNYVDSFDGDDEFFQNEEDALEYLD